MPPTTNTSTSPQPSSIHTPHPNAVVWLEDAVGDGLKEGEAVKVGRSVEEAVGDGVSVRMTG